MICSKCMTKKTATNFYKTKKGRHYWCKACCSENSKKWNAKKREERKAIMTPVKCKFITADGWKTIMKQQPRETITTAFGDTNKTFVFLRQSGKTHIYAEVQ